jgi:RecB family exonuclease
MAHLPYMSASRLKLYEECPQKYAFNYVEKIPQAERSYFSFGSTVHAALEAWLKPLTLAPTQPIGDLTQLLTFYDTEWLRAGYESQEQEFKYYEKGIALLTDYYAQYTAARPRTIAVEREMSAVFGDVKVKGIVDRVDFDEATGLEILDYKSGVKLSQRDANESEQLTLYQILVDRAYHLPVAKLTLVHLVAGRTYSCPPRTDDDIAALVEKTQRIATLIREDVFPTNVGRWCERCEYRERCPAWRQ